MHMIHGCWTPSIDLQGQEYTNTNKHDYTCETKERQRHCGALTSVARGHGNKGRQNDRDGDDDADEDDDYDGVEDEDVVHEDDDKF